MAFTDPTRRYRSDDLPPGDLVADPAAMPAPETMPTASAPRLGRSSGGGGLRAALKRGAIAGLQGLYGSYLAGRGEYEAAGQEQMRVEEQRRFADLQMRRQRAHQELARNAVDPFSEAGARDAFAILYEYGLTDEIDALAKVIAAQNAARSEGPAEYEVVDPTTGKPRKMVRQADGSFRDVGEAVPKRPLVEIGGNGLKTPEAIAAEDRGRAGVDATTKTIRDKLSAFGQLSAVYAKIKREGRAPNAAETDTITKLAARTENPEAVQEGDIYRKAGGSLANVVRRWGGLPPELDVDQMDAIYATAATLAEAAQNELSGYEAQARSVAEGRGLNPAAVASGAPAVPVQTPALPPRDQLKAGETYQLPDGRRARWDGDAFEVLE